MKQSLMIVLLGATLAAQTPATPVQELKPPPPPPPTAPASPASAPATRTAVAHAPVTALPVKATTAPDAAPLSFAGGTFKFYWDTAIPMNMEVDGLKIKEIYFNVRHSRYSWLHEAEFGTRAHVTVSNTSSRARVPGFAVAVLDADGKLLGVASGGTKVGTVEPGATEDFDLNFTQVKERLPKGATFLFSVELRD